MCVCPFYASLRFKMKFILIINILVRLKSGVEGRLGQRQKILIIQHIWVVLLSSSSFSGGAGLGMLLGRALPFCSGLGRLMYRCVSCFSVSDHICVLSCHLSSSFSCSVYFFSFLFLFKIFVCSLQFHLSFHFAFDFLFTFQNTFGAKK